MSTLPNYHLLQKRDIKFTRAIERAYGAYKAEFTIMAPTLMNNKSMDTIPTAIVEGYPPGNPVSRQTEHIPFSDLGEGVGAIPQNEANWAAILDAKAAKFRRKFQNKKLRKDITDGNATEAGFNDE